MLNKKILTSIVFSFVFVFSVFLFMYVLYPPGNSSLHPFYSSIIPHENNIFLIGSSQVGRLNNTMIHEIISAKYPDHAVYNLASVVDTPKIRSDTLDSLISLHPKVVVYGISYRDFLSLKQDSIINNDPILPYLRLSNLPFSLPNPQALLLHIVKTSQITNNDIIFLDNTPFNGLSQSQMIISTDAQLNLHMSAYAAKLENYEMIPLPVNEQFNHLKKIIEEFSNNDIKVIILVLPLSHNYLEYVPEDQKQTMNLILSELSQITKIYDLTDRYSVLPIWSDSIHVAYNKNSTIFSYDVANIISTELNR